MMMVYEPSEPLTRRQIFYLDFMLDVLWYTVVLNLADEFVDSIVIDSFLVSLLTAVVLKALIDTIELVMDRVKDRYGAREGPGAKAALIGLTWAVLFSSKFAILWTVNIVFEDDVDLGGFLEVLVLVLVMMVVRRLSLAVFQRLGVPRGADRG